MQAFERVLEYACKKRGAGETGQFASSSVFQILAILVVSNNCKIGQFF